MKKKLFGLILILLITPEFFAAQDSTGFSSKYFFFPGKQNNWEGKFYSGLSLAQLPTKIVEDVFDQVPTLELKYITGILPNLSLKGELNTNVITNQLVISPDYNFSINKFSFAVGNDLTFWYGFFKSDGFDVSVVGWGYSPFITAGFNADDFFLSMKIAADVRAQNTFMKSLRYKDSSPKFVGFTMTIAIEQPLWGNNYMALGFRAYYTKFFYKSWLSFSTFDQYLYYPEFFAGFVF